MSLHTTNTTSSAGILKTSYDRFQDRTKDHQYRHPPPWWIRLGGPNTVLPEYLESFFCWTLAVSCLSVSGYHYIIENYIKPYYPSIRHLQEYFRRVVADRKDRIHRKRIPSYRPQRQPTQQPHQQLPCWIPLMTYSRAEVQRHTPLQRYAQLIQVLQSMNPSYVTMIQSDTTSTNNNANIVTQSNLSDDELSQLIRDNEILRRLVSLTVRPMDPTSVMEKNTVAWQHHHHYQQQYQPLLQQLIRIYAHLLTLPPIQPIITMHCHSSHKGFVKPIHQITALILPCYKEEPIDIIDKLSYALQHCDHPQYVQVVVVMAGTTAVIDQHNLQKMMITNASSMYSCDTGTKTSTSSSTTTDYNTNQTKQWGTIKIIDFVEESGRGPCMNYGANYAKRSNPNVVLYSFCHSDTVLPKHWDTTLLQTLYPVETKLVLNHNRKNHDDDDTGRLKKTDAAAAAPPPTKSIRINSCAYNFGIDTSRLRRTDSCVDNNRIPTKEYIPPGLKAIVTTANLRCQLWSLPYGDQCISMRVRDFHYIGGFPHQCFMEDYELIALLRKRVKLLSHYQTANNNSSTTTTGIENEVLQILPGPPVLCSPRRWQKYGVFYVTYTNSRLVNLYSSGKASPDDIYQLYYGHTLDVIAPKSPWEVELEQILLAR
jgi:hypothetical protein